MDRFTNTTFRAGRKGYSGIDGAPLSCPKSFVSSEESPNGRAQLFVRSFVLAVRALHTLRNSRVYIVTGVSLSRFRKAAPVWPVGDLLTRD